VARYGVNYYGASKYGAFAKLAYSVEPMSALVLTFTKVEVSWQTPRGTFSRVRLVRNQAGYPETAEDGVIIFDEYATEGTVSRSYFIDGEDNPTDTPFVSGRQTYYRFFLFTDQNVWRVAGSINVTIPSDHNAQGKFINTLPRVFTSAEQTPLGAVDTSSDLYKFIDGLLFTFEESLTFLDLLRPRHTGLETPLQLLPVEASNVGLTQEPSLPTKNRKRLIREAFYMYTRKGTKLGLETYVESLTGFSPTITVSENLLLSVEDSTFYGGTGNWVATNATLSSSTEQVPDSVTNQIDTTKTGKVIAANSGSMTLGLDNPITKGVPVEPETEYIVSCKLKSPASAGNITLSVRFYDKDGAATSTATSATAVSANNTWKSSSVTATSDADSSYAVITIAYSAAGTYYIDQVCMQTGDTVAYDEARAVDVFLNPIKTNLITNPSFEVNTTDGWTIDGLATFAQDPDVSNLAYSGSNSGLVTATGAWTLTSNAMPITAGSFHTVSGLTKTTEDLTITFIGRDDNGDVVEDEDVYPLGTIDDWSRFTATDLVDATLSTVVTYEVVFSGDSGDYYLDCIQFEKSPIASDYFDGSLPADFGAVWEGTDDDSYSHLYPNKPQKVDRLGKTLIDWMPMNAFWRLRTYDGVEYTNLTV
jgi:phage tail-like protein